MVKPLHRPSVVGCAIGFAAAGCGVGSLVGTALGPLLYPPLPDGQGTMDERVLVMYGGTFLGIKAGLVVGALAGVLYAVLVRRSRRSRRSRRPQAPDAEPGAAADPAS
jgi:hypothetical protein